MGDMGAEREIDARLNELDYFNLSAAHAAHTGAPEPHTPDEFVNHIRDVMGAWSRAEIQGNESYAVLRDARGRDADRRRAARPPGPVRHLGRCDRHDGAPYPRPRSRRAWRICWCPIRNASIHRVAVLSQGTILAGFNATPHLDGPDRRHARTEY
jgi:hypothetical protein